MSERTSIKQSLPPWLPSAVSALVLGAHIGCDTAAKPATRASTSVERASASPEQAPVNAPSATAASSHAAVDRQRDCCMGKNECKGKGGCAVPESHACRGQNACKGKGGCNGHCPRE